MRILGLTHSFSGCGYHRISVPVCNLPKEYGRITDLSTDEVFENNYDIVYVNRLWDETIFEQREKFGFKLVLDLDDYWILDHDHMDYDNYRSNAYDSKVISFMKRADLVTVTHERIAEQVKSYNPNVLVVPNAIPYGWSQFTNEVEPSETVRLFWAGGISHELDLKLLEQPMKIISNDKLNVSCVMGGYADSNMTEMRIWDNMVKYFTCNGHIKNNIMRGLPVYEYYGFYQFADIALIPLRKSMFNQYKSNLKILEAAGKGIPVIVSKTHPYLGFPEDLVNYAKDTADWVKHIKRLVDNPTLRKEQGQALQEYCMKHYNFDQINKKRSEAFESLLVV